MAETSETVVSSDRAATKNVDGAPKKLCPNCGTDNNIRNKFCRKCRYSFESESAPDDQALAQPLLQEPSTQSTVTRSRSQELRMFSVTHLTPITAALKRFKASHSLRELYIEMAVVYVEQQDYTNAIDTLQQALNAEDGSIQNSEILFYLAYIYELMQDRSHAFRTYLEAVLAAPASIDEILPYTHSLLTPDIALEQSRWVLDKNGWEEQVKRVCANAVNRMHVALLFAHIYVLLDRYAKAQEYLREAAQQAPEVAPTMTSYLFAPDGLPPALASAETDGTMALTLAQLYQALGNVQMALEEVEHALTLLVADGRGGSTLAEADQCKAELLEQQGNNKEAAKYFFDAGSQYMAINDFQAAIEPLRRANRLDDQHIATYWNLAESLRMASYNLGGDVERIKSLLNESLDVWQRGYTLKHPDKEDAWAYISRAWMSDQLRRLPDARPWAIMWEALAYLERGALYDRPPSTDSSLAFYYRMLRLPQNALALTEKAMEAAPDDEYVLNERYSSLDDVGEYAEAEKVIDKLLTLQEQQGEQDQQKQNEQYLQKLMDIQVTKAYILVRLERFKEVLPLLDKALAEDAPGATDISRLRAYALRAYCHRVLGNRAEMKADAQKLRAFYKESDTDYWSIYAWSSFFLGLDGVEGEIDFALTLCQQQIDRPGESPGDRLCLSAFCLLALGKSAEAEDLLRKSVMVSTTQRQLKDLRENISEVENFAPDFAHQPQVEAAFEHMKEQIDERMAALVPPSPEDELKAAIKAGEEDTDKSDGWAKIAAMAGLGRLYTDEKHWQESFETYRQLAEIAGEPFPEAVTQRDETLDHIFDMLDEVIRTISEEKVTQLLELINYLQSLAGLGDNKTKSGYLTPDNDPKRLARLNCQMGYVRLLIDLVNDEAQQKYLAGTEESRSTLRQNMQELAGAPGYFILALALYYSKGSPEDFARACRSFLMDPRYYWYLDALLGEMSQVEETIEGLHNVIEIARNALMSYYLDDTFHLSVEAPANVIPDPPYATASIYLELGLDLIPAEAFQEKEYVWPLFENYLPDLRRRLNDELGITLPGVQVQDNQWIGKLSYRIQHYDTVLAEGETQPGMGYTLASLDTLKQLGVPEDKPIPAPHPFSGTTGYWVPLEWCETLSKHHEPVWPDPIRFASCAIEAVVRSNQGSLLEVQAVQSLLDSWTKATTDKKWANRLSSLLSDPAARFRFMRLLRLLAQEQVSLADWQAILDAAEQLNLLTDSLSELVCKMRVRLKRQLGGNKSGAQRLELTSEWEDKLQACIKEQDGLTTLVVLPEVTAELSQWVRDQVQPGTTGWNHTLITQNAALRPFLWLLLHTTFPFLSVLSQDELLTVDEMEKVGQMSDSKHIK